ncbi:hypothetical protein B7P43_G13914 [Cryptotermes secundus]|uniref:Uncharacterized protein n=1 Tax=Cryptotermes secundus TaxID=105785 RepID=A0A2J7RRF9_9NEOP|nr:uncharacterized protein LOC111862799 isoform X2 [Cryptotermes secundus]PNF43395.1 hypothetical protein B7P43_G13914 [Cryptotermes secundus]
MSSIGGASSDTVDKHETTGDSGKMIRLSQPDAMWGEQLLKAAADLAGTDHDGSDSELSDSDHFLTKGAFLLTPSRELSMEKASSICEKMSFKGLFSLTKTATGILFKFSEPEDYLAVFKKGFHKVTNARFYKKVPIPCRPQKTFTVFVLEIPEDIPEEDIRHSLYKFQSVVEVARLPKDSGTGMTSGTGSAAAEKTTAGNPGSADKAAGLPVISTSPPLVRVTVASLEERNTLLQNGLDFYGATFFPTEAAEATTVLRTSGRKSFLGNRVFDVVTASGRRVRDMLPVFDAAGFSKISPPTVRTVKPRRSN